MYQISGSIEGTTLKFTKFHANYEYGCPPIDIAGIAPCFAYQQEADVLAHLVDPVKWYEVFKDICPVREDNY